MKYLQIFLFSLIALLLCSCHNLYLKEQLDPPDRRVPIVIDDYTQPGILKTRNFWKHKGNYYTKLRVHYARERHPLFHNISSHERIYTDTEPGEYYYFPLTDKEVNKLLDLPENSIRQPADAMKLPILRVAEQNSREWQQVTMKLGNASTPKSSLYRNSCLGAYSIGALPERKGTRETWQTLLYGPAWVVDTAANAAILTVEAPFYGTTLLLYYLMSGFML